MEIQKKIENDFKTAFKSGDEVSKRTLRMVLASIKLVEVEKGRALTDEEVLSILQKEIKSLRESITDAEKAGRDDLIAQSEPEIQSEKAYRHKHQGHPNQRNQIRQHRTASRIYTLVSRTTLSQVVRPGLLHSF